MQVTISVDFRGVDRLVSRFPRATTHALNNFVERTGYTLEASSKRNSPHVTGTLKRMTRFDPRSGVLTAGANYSKYVHGAPFYNNRTRRKETPFFTHALLDSRSAIKNHANSIIKDIKSNI